MPFHLSLAEAGPRPASHLQPVPAQPPWLGPARSSLETVQQWNSNLKYWKRRKRNKKWLSCFIRPSKDRNQRLGGLFFTTTLACYQIGGVVKWVALWLAGVHLWLAPVASQVHLARSFCATHFSPHAHVSSHRSTWLQWWFSRKRLCLSSEVTNPSRWQKHIYEIWEEQLTDAPSSARSRHSPRPGAPHATSDADARRARWVGGHRVGEAQRWGSGDEGNVSTLHRCNCTPS